jgi:hypothetical protein
MRSEGHKLPDLTFITLLAAVLVLAAWILPDGCRRDLKVVSIPVVSGLALAGISLTPAASQSRLQSATALCATSRMRCGRAAVFSSTQGLTSTSAMCLTAALANATFQQL